MTTSPQPGAPAASLATLPEVSLVCEHSRRQLMIALAQYRRAEAALESHAFIGGTQSPAAWVDAGATPS